MPASGRRAASRTAAADPGGPIRLLTRSEYGLPAPPGLLLGAHDRAAEETDELIDMNIRLTSFYETFSAQDRPENLVRFAELLTAHIRFEEQALFARAQELLEPDQLSELVMASPLIIGPTIHCGSALRARISADAGCRIIRRAPLRSSKGGGA